MSEPDGSAPDAVARVTIADRLRAIEPIDARPLGSLAERLTRSDLVIGARLDGRAAAPSELARIAVGGPVADSRRVAPGSLFVAIAGERLDGHEFLAAASGGGATAAIVERPIADVRLPQLVVRSGRAALAEAAGWWYDDPSAELGVVGVTGTDGKTTTSFLAVAALQAAGITTGLIGTVHVRVGGTEEPTPSHVTTPEAPALQALLRAMVAGGDRAAIVETTSHGLALERVRGVAYDVAILTNLSHEHLELHGTYEAYRAAKLRLFESLAVGRASKDLLDGRPWPRAGVVNRDDPAAPWFMAATRAAGAQLVTYGTDVAADVRATRVEEDGRRLRVAYAAPSGSGTVELQLGGRFNVHNALAVIAAGEAIGLDQIAVRAGLAAVPAIPGRMERIDAGQPFGIVVDFAHSPASLAAVLDLLAPVAAARGGGLVVVFGSAGERDRGKRPIMGRIAAQRCRLVVLADEDPRAEEPAAILEEIAAGAVAAGQRRDIDLLLIPDRRAAIAEALARARPGDLVLLAGKGHERTIEYADHDEPWDERAVAEAALAGLGFADGPGPAARLRA